MADGTPTIRRRDDPPSEEPSRPDTDERGEADPSTPPVPSSAEPSEGESPDGRREPGTEEGTDDRTGEGTEARTGDETTAEGGPWVPVASAGEVAIEGPTSVDAARATDIEDLAPRERRRRRRRARRDGRYLFRGRVFPRTLRAVVAVAVAMGLAAGAAAASVYAVMDARVARADKESTAPPPTTAPVGGIVEPGAPGDPALSEIIIDANATGADATIEGFAVAVSDDQDRTYWLTAYDVVAASTVVPPSPVTLRSTGDAVEVWTWDEPTGLGLIATRDVEAAPRTWIPADTTITSGSLLTVTLPTDGPPLPVTVSVDEPLTGPRDSFTVRADGVILPLGAGVTAPDGRLVGVLTAADYAEGNTVATVTAIRRACSVVLDCTDVGG